MAMCTAPQHSLSTGHPPTVPARTRPGEEPVQGPARHSRQHTPHPPLPRNVSVACLPIPTLNVVPSVGFHDRGLVPLLLHSERAITHRPRSTASASPVQNVAGSPPGMRKGPRPGMRWPVPAPREPTGREAVRSTGSLGEWGSGQRAARGRVGRFAAHLVVLGYRSTVAGAGEINFDKWRP